jgi:hypothetical protein
MVSYTKAAMERAMEVQEVILRALAKKITWWQAAEILGISDRHMRRWRERYEEFGYDGLYNRRLGKLALQGAGLVNREGKRGVHRKRRPRRPLPEMLLHIDGSRHCWFKDERWYDLIVILDDGTSEIYYAQLVEEESTLTVMAGLKEVIQRKGVFCGVIQRSRQPLLAYTHGGRQDRSAPADASGSSPAGFGCANDPGLFAAGTWSFGAHLRHLARTLAAGTAAARNPHGGGGQSLLARALRRRVQCSVSSAGCAAGKCVCCAAPAEIWT